VKRLLSTVFAKMFTKAFSVTHEQFAMKHLRVNSNSMDLPTVFARLACSCSDAERAFVEAERSSTVECNDNIILAAVVQQPINRVSDGRGKFIHFAGLHPGRGAWPRVWCRRRESLAPKALRRGGGGV
jgi:hypothetical protein